MVEFFHIPVLLKECIKGLNIKPNGTYVDGTTGAAGHSYHILQELTSSGSLYCFDQDIAAIEASRIRLSSLSSRNFTLIHSNFKNMKKELEWYDVGEVDGIIFDLGVSSFQLNQAERGFSYNRNAILDMRMDQSQELTAKKVVNTYSEEKLTRILFDYGEEKFARKIAAAIVAARKEKEIETTYDLVEIISKAMPGFAKREKGHPAKRTFQAIRIEVNSELSILRDSLEQALSLLKSGGRLCVITFHSLEDRIVKQLFKEKTSSTPWHRGLPITNKEEKIEYRLVNNKPILPSDEEIENNNRAHSAKLRIIEKI